MKSVDVIIIGAGAAGFMCAIEAGKRGREVLLIDHANKPGKKILMSGGGRCNFTNLNITPNNYLSHNPHFCKSALKRYTQWDFIDMVKRYNIPYHEKTLGQLFCDDKAKDIVNMLIAESQKYQVSLQLDESVLNIKKSDEGFIVQTSVALYKCESLVIASGGLSIPTLGATGFGYDVAQQFGIACHKTRASLVGLSLPARDLKRYEDLPGISCMTTVSCGKQTFKENILFTHKGLSGPAILQISNYWQHNAPLTINLLPGIDLLEEFKLQQRKHPNQQFKEFLSQFLPKRLVLAFLDEAVAHSTLQSISHAQLLKIAEYFQQWFIIPNNTMGYKTAEVTLGGVDCDAISSKTMESLMTKGLYFIGEVLDVTGWLGGYNFQWAWSSGWAAGGVC